MEPNEIEESVEAGEWENTETIEIPDDFMSVRPMNAPPAERELFREDD